MKTVSLTFSAAVLSASLGAQADEGTTPAAVKDAFAKAYPQAIDVEYEPKTAGGNTVYEVEFKVQGQEMEARYGADGALLRTEIEIGVDALPEPVKRAVAAAYPKARLEEAEKRMKPDGTVLGYEIELKEAGIETTVETDGDGKILSAGSEHDGD